MKEMYKCEYCNETFEIKEECLKHEIDIHKGTEKYYSLIRNILNELNNKYNMNKEIKSCDIDINPKFSNGYEWMSFEVSIDLDYTYLINISSSEDFIVDKIKCEMESCYLDEVNNIEGTLMFEDWCGGDGADDYIINGVYLKDFLYGKQGKHINIQIY